MWLVRSQLIRTIEVWTRWEKIPEEMTIYRITFSYRNQIFKKALSSSNKFRIQVPPVLIERWKWKNFPCIRVKMSLWWLVNRLLRNRSKYNSSCRPKNSDLNSSMKESWTSNNKISKNRYIKAKIMRIKNRLEKLLRSPKILLSHR